MHLCPFGWLRANHGPPPVLRPEPRASFPRLLTATGAHAQGLGGDSWAAAQGAAQQRPASAAELELDEGMASLGAAWGPFI